MDKLTFYNSRKKYIKFLALSAVFVFVGMFFLFQPSLENKLPGFFSVVFFGACSLVFIRQLFDTRPRLIIDSTGVYDRTLGIGTIPWNEIEDAEVYDIRNQYFISLQLTDSNKYLAMLSKNKLALVKANVSIGFQPINLNLSGLDVDPNEICSLIIEKSMQTGGHGQESSRFPQIPRLPD